MRKIALFAAAMLCGRHGLRKSLPAGNEEDRRRDGEEPASCPRRRWPTSRSLAPKARRCTRPASTPSRSPSSRRRRRSSTSSDAQARSRNARSDCVIPAQVRIRRSSSREGGDDSAGFPPSRERRRRQPASPSPRNDRRGIDASRQRSERRTGESVLGQPRCAEPVGDRRRRMANQQRRLHRKRQRLRDAARRSRIDRVRSKIARERVDRRVEAAIQAGRCRKLGLQARRARRCRVTAPAARRAR